MDIPTLNSSHFRDPIHLNRAGLVAVVSGIQETLWTAGNRRHDLIRNSFSSKRGFCDRGCHPLGQPLRFMSSFRTCPFLQLLQLRGLAPREVSLPLPSLNRQLRLRGLALHEV
jgi:hypothetical protein